MDEQHTTVNTQTDITKITKKYCRRETKVIYRFTADNTNENFKKKIRRLFQVKY